MKVSVLVVALTALFAAPAWANCNTVMGGCEKEEAAVGAAHLHADLPAEVKTKAEIAAWKSALGVDGKAAVASADHKKQVEQVKK